MSSINFTDNCWDKYEEFHKRFITKNNNMENILEIFTKLQISLRDFSKAINNVIMKDYLLFPEQNSSQNDALEFIKYILTIQTTQFNVAIDLLKNKILVPLRQKKEENLKKEKELFLELKKLNIKYNESLINLQKSKEKYYQSANIAEMSTKSAKETSLLKLNNNIDKKQQNLFNLLEQKSLEALIEAKKNDEKYNELLKEANINRENSIKKQYELLNYYKEMEYNDFQTYKCLLLDYLCNLKTENSIIKGSLMEMEEKISKMNIEKDLDILIKKYSSEKKPDEEIKYEIYNPKIDVKNCYKDDEYKLYYNTIVTMKSYLNILPNFDINKESKIQELRELCKIFFSLNINYNESVNQGILEILKKEWTHDIFLVILSKQRTNGRYCRTKKLINDLGTILNFIIDMCHKTLNYHPVKTCIILSQTFYYEEKNKKVYLYNILNKNKWLKRPDFWRNLINFMIENETNNKKEETNNQINKKNLENIVFSQILAYMTSMKDFKIDIRIILKITDELIKKYEISNEVSSLIYSNFGDEKYIENLRNEYESMPDLEQKIIDEINSEQKHEKKEENVNDNKKEEKLKDKDDNNKIVEQNPNNEDNKENDNKIIDNKTIEKEENKNIENDNKDENNIVNEKEEVKEENKNDDNNESNKEIEKKEENNIKEE